MKNRKGLTLLELMVSMSLASMVFILAGSFMAFVVNKNTKNQRTELFEQAKNDLARELTNSIKWAEHIEVTGSGVVADGANFHLASGKIKKNGEDISPDGITVNSFEVKDYSLSPTLSSLQIRVEMQNSTYPLSKDSLRLVISQRKTEVETE
jgi:prepilin-type N-terminal cleavage/methylation domain-containing protein